MQEVRCPACGQQQIAGASFCSFCYARFDTSPQDPQHQSELSDSMPSQSSFSFTSSDLTSLPTPLKLFFEHPIKAPLLWMGISFLAIMFIFTSYSGLIQDSFPRWLVFVSLLGAVVLSQIFYQKYYPSIAALGEGGYSPPVQRTLLSIGYLMAILAGFLFCVWKLFWVGIPLILVGFGAMLISSGGVGRRKGMLKSFSELVNSRERLDFKGVAWAERFSLVLILAGVLLGMGMMLDMLIPTGKPDHQIKILGKEEHHESRGRNVYTLKIAGWKTPKNRIEIRRSRIEWQRIDVGGTYRMHTRRGLFGGERIVRINPDLEAMHNGD